MFQRTSKSAGYGKELSYLSWTFAWSNVKLRYPDANYEIVKFENGLPYVYDAKTGYMVFTKVTIEGTTHEMWLPVMDSHNEAMLDHLTPNSIKTLLLKLKQLQCSTLTRLSCVVL